MLQGASVARLEVMSTVLCSTRLRRHSSSSSSTRRSTMGRPRRSTGTRRRRSMATNRRRPSRGSSPLLPAKPLPSRAPPQQGSYSNQVRSANAASCISHGSLAAAPSLYYSGSLLRSRLQTAEPMHIPCRYTSFSRQQGDLLLRDLGLVERQHPRWKGKWSFALCSVLC